jgi:hypothetical protein
VTVAAAFGLRDNVARALSEDVAADALAQSTAICSEHRSSCWRTSCAARRRYRGSKQTVVFAAIFLGQSELVGRRLVVVALLVVAGGTLVGATG